MSSAEYEPGDRVRILVGGPHENLDREATVSRVQDNKFGGKLVAIHFGDEKEWMYSPHELGRLS